MPLNQQQIETFANRGVIVLKGFFSVATMDEISAYLDVLPDKQSNEREDAKYYETSPISGESILVRIENVVGEHNAGLRNLLLASKTNECLTQLFGEPPVLFKDKINFKMPGCRADKLHQDQAAGWNHYSDFFISMIIVVDENRKENGALSFMNSGNYERKLMTDEWKPLCENDPPYSPEDEYIMLEADPGDVVFFDSYVPHGSPPNASDKCRRNIFLTFNKLSDGDMRARYYEDKWVSYMPNDAAEARRDKSFRV